MTISGNTASRLALYSAVGPRITHYALDADTGTLTARGGVDLPAPVQYVWPHRSRKFLYATSSTGGPYATGQEHFANALRVDPATGALALHGPAVRLPWRPVHSSLDETGGFLLMACNEPAALAVRRIEADGTIGGEIPQPADLDLGIYPHQIRTTPGNRSVILVARGNNATASRPEDPGALKVFSFDRGQLRNLCSSQPGDGLGFGPRHVDFHPEKPWVFTAIERQNQLCVHEIGPDGSLARDALFVKSTLPGPDPHESSAGAVHVHPNGRFVYVTNRGAWGTRVRPDQEMFENFPVFDKTSSDVAVFSVDQRSGEPTLIQNADSHGAHPRTFSIDPTGKVLVAGNLVPVAISDGSGTRLMPAGLALFTIGEDGKLTFAGRTDLPIGKLMQWWIGIIALP